MSGDLRQLLPLQGVPSSRVNTMKAHQPCPDAGASLPMRESAAFQLLSWEALCARDRIEWNVQILPGRGPWNRTFQRLSADPEEPFEDLIIELAAEIDYLSGEIYDLTKQINEKDAEAKIKDDFY